MINVMINGLAESEYLEIVTISKIPLLLADKRNKGALPLIDHMVNLHSVSLHIIQFSFHHNLMRNFNGVFPPVVNPLKHVENAFSLKERRHLSATGRVVTSPQMRTCHGRRVKSKGKPPSKFT